MTMTTTELARQLSPDALALIDGPTNWIGGRWEDGESAGTLSLVNPSTTDEIRTVPGASAGQAERAVLAARNAFDSGVWSDTSPRERSAALLRLADIMDAHRDELAEIIVTEVGTPITLTRAMQIGMPVGNIRWAADMALRGPQGGYEQGLPPHMGPPPSASLLQRVPVGVVAGITGYNFPINSVAWKLGPGLAAGCTLVLKPSPRTPLSTLAFMRLVEKADLPPGAVNFVLGETDAGKVLTTHRGVDMVMFTGSLAVGQHIMRDAADTTKRVVLELGGKSATIVLPGTDMDEIVGASINRFARNSGQGCGATTRILIPRRQYDEYADAASRFIDRMTIGSPWDESADLGPLIRAEQRDFVEGHLNGALERGASIVAGGGRPDLPGYFLNAAIVGNVANSDVICQEELFGPVGALLPYDDVEEALDIAHDSPYGLHAAVFGPPAQAHQLALRLRTGAVSVNGGGFMRPEGPWGGFGLSGFGREMGEDGFREFFQVKHIQWPMR